MAVKTDEIWSADELVKIPVKKLNTGGHAWDAGKTYVIGDIVMIDKIMYSALADNIGMDPHTSHTDWYTLIAIPLPDELRTHIDAGGVVAWNGVANLGPTSGRIYPDGSIRGSHIYGTGNLNRSDWVKYPNGDLFVDGYSGKSMSASGTAAYFAMEYGIKFSVFPTVLTSLADNHFTTRVFEWAINSRTLQGASVAYSSFDKSSFGGNGTVYYRVIGKWK